MAILLNGWTLPTGGGALGKVLRLQPAQQACFYIKDGWERLRSKTMNIRLYVSVMLIQKEFGQTSTRANKE